MKNYLNWLLLLLIYLSVNGQVFSTPVHICQAMAIKNQTLLASPAAIKIHDHHQINTSTIDHTGAHTNANAESSNLPMKGCHCIDCDCTENILGQANGYLLYSPLTVVSVKTDTLLVEGEQHFISQPHPNLFRPPIAL